MTADDWDPYLGCEDGCMHTLDPGILTSDLQREGPYKTAEGFPNAGMQVAATLLRLMQDREERDASDTTDT